MIDENKIRQEMREWIIQRIDAFPSNYTRTLIMDFAAENRVISTGPHQGAYDPEYTKYLVEPINELSICYPAQRVIVVKGAQGGWTTGGENAVCYFIGPHPTDQLYISGTDNLLERWAERKLDPAIDAFGLRDKIQSLRQSKSNKGSGDKTYRKLYSNCALDLVSARSASSLRAEDKQFLFRDEIDSAPKILVTGEGSYLEVSYARTIAWGDRRKIYDISTPTTENSLIWNEYLQGDRRKYYVQCSSCGIYQPLEFGEEEGEKKTYFGLKGDFDGNTLKEVYYQCAHCKDRISENEKMRLINTGKWTPTCESSLEYTKSYADNALIRPPGMINWRELYLKWKKAKSDPELMTSFRNLYMGLPAEQSSVRPVIELVDVNRSNYNSWQVPEGVLYLTMGCDVQRGSERIRDRQHRLELEILGHGRGYRTCSIGYKVINGAVTNAFEGAWEELYKWILETGLAFPRKDGINIPTALGFIDSGDGVLKNVVYQFCKRLNGIYPSKGFQSLKKKRGDKYYRDIPSERDKVKYRYVKLSDSVLYEMATVYYKNLIYGNLTIPRNEGLVQAPGFCDFPCDYPESYFRELTSEERSEEDGSYSSNGRKNEALDCRVMALCAGDVYLDKMVHDAQESKQKLGWSNAKVTEVINSKYILSLLEKRIESAKR